MWIQQCLQIRKHNYTIYQRAYFLKICFDFKVDKVYRGLIEYSNNQIIPLKPGTDMVH